MRRDVFYYFSRHGIHIYTITRAWTSFATIRSNIVQVNRVENMDSTGKILVLAGDSSIRFLSPLSGTSLATAMPYLSMVDPLAAVYCSQRSLSAKN